MAKKSYTDTSELENYFKQLKALEKKEVEYGFFDDAHYSGLNMATLAAIHEQGWNNLTERSFIYSTAMHYRGGLANNIKLMHYSIIQGKGFDNHLNKIGKDGADSIRMTIEQGSFPNPKVSRDWASVKGFDDAMVHYGDLGAAATFRVVSSMSRRK